ncbi:MAG TPA: patatin-like phospholipase family protein [Bacteroidales bacterium]|nr:patatin-like phospholipase family protein [Bacteroidales bacterium]HPR73325.1 patatin-like phospholipase family protein [Bacteroidales bacterium]
MKNTGLALGGGAVLGAAHVGTVRAIEELNIRIHYIAGTSIGAFVAAFYAFGKSWKELEKIASVINWLDITGISLSRYGLLSNEKLGDMIIEQIGDKNIEDSEIPLAMVATDITTGEKVILKKGSVAQAVRASTCIPGIFMPVEIDGQMLVDGGVVENVPVNTVKEMGAEYIIGVDLNAKYSYEKPDNILDVILNSFNFLMLQSDKLQTDNADLLIKPDLSSFNRSDTDQVDELMKKGYEDSINVLKKIT